MSLIEQFVNELEVKERDAEMYFSVYYIPPEFQPEGHPYDH